MPEKINNDKTMALIDHLDELRTRMIYCIVALVVGTLIGWFLSLDALQFLQSSYTDSPFFMAQKEIKLEKRTAAIRDSLAQLDEGWKEKRKAFGAAPGQGATATAFLDEMDARWDALVGQVVAINAELDRQNNKQRIRLMYLGPTDALFMRLKLALVIGIAITCPFWMYQIWAFVAPGLTGSEKRVVIPATMFASILFLAGIAFAVVAIPLTLKVLTSFGGDVLDAQFTVNRFMSFALTMILAFGAVFELPVVLLILVKMGILTPEQLRQNRRYAIIAILIIAAMLTPGGDPLTLAIMAGPLYLLFEFSIYLTKYVVPPEKSRWDT